MLEHNLPLCPRRHRLLRRSELLERQHPGDRNNQQPARSRLQYRLQRGRIRPVYDLMNDHTLVRVGILRHRNNARDLSPIPDARDQVARHRP